MDSCSAALDSDDLPDRTLFPDDDDQEHKVRVLIVDRRAGCIPSAKNEELCALLRRIDLPGVELWVETVKEYRLVLVLRGEGLSPEVEDTDPHAVGVRPLEPVANAPQAEETARLVGQFLDRADAILVDHHPANMVLLRGFSSRPRWPSFQDVFGLRAAAISSYPMYRGVAQLVGMETLEAGPTLRNRSGTLRACREDYDFFFLHVKRIDSAGEDGDFERKVKLIEEVDGLVPDLLDMRPDVLLVTGDHLTPVRLRSHSWHPVPTILWSERALPAGRGRSLWRACLHRRRPWTAYTGNRIGAFGRGQCAAPVQVWDLTGRKRGCVLR